MLNAYDFSFLLLNHSNRLNRTEICITFQYKKLPSCSSDLYSKSSLFKLFGTEKKKTFFLFIKDCVINEHYVSKITRKRLIHFVNVL